MPLTYRIINVRESKHGAILISLCNQKDIMKLPGVEMGYVFSKTLLVFI